jgi:hypothetical protein
MTDEKLADVLSEFVDKVTGPPPRCSIRYDLSGSLALRAVRKMPKGRR